MTGALSLGLYAVAAGWGLPALIGQRLGASPRVAIATWLAGCASVLVAVVLAALQLAFPDHAIGDRFAALVAACSSLLAGHALPPTARPLTVAVGLAMVGVLVTRLCWAAVRVCWAARRGRAEHRRAVELVGRPSRELGALVVEHAEPAAYCVPGRRGVVVVTSGALTALDRRQVAAVLAHERAHVDGRHHVLLTAAQVAARVLPWVPLFKATGTAVPGLVELLADDVAAREHDSCVIASALIALARASTPASTLGAGGETAVARVKRLLSPTPPPSLRDRALGALGVAWLLTAPATATLLPSLLSCPVIA